MSALKVNKRLLPFKVHYFLKNGGEGFLPFAAPVMIQRGISPQGVGFIYTLNTLISAVLNIFFGFMADKWKLHKALLLLLCVLLAASFLSLFFLPSMPKTRSSSKEKIQSVICFENRDSLSSCFSRVNMSFSVSEKINNCELKCLSEEIIQQKALKLNSNDGDTLMKFKINISDVGRCIITSELESNDLWLHSIVNCQAVAYPECVEACFDEKQMQERSFTESLAMLPFWLNTICLILIFVAMDCSSSLADTMCLAVLNKDHNKYGQQRLFGALGWGLMGVIMGGLVDLFSENHLEPNYAPAIAITTVLLTVNIFTSMFITANVPGKQQARGVWNVLFSFLCVNLLVTSFLMGTTMGLICTFEFIYLKEVSVIWNSNFTATNLLQGIIIFMDCVVGEMPFMFLSGYIIAKIGNIHTFSLNLAVSSFRLLLYAVTTNPWLFIPIHLLHGVAFGVFVANMVSYANYLAPKGSQATLQSMTLASYTIGKASGAFLGGILMEKIGGSATFLVMTSVLTFYTVLYAFINCIYQRRNKAVLSKINSLPEELARDEYNCEEIPEDAKMTDSAKQSALRDIAEESL